jgi:hypothetical protein
MQQREILQVLQMNSEMPEVVTAPVLAALSFETEQSVNADPVMVARGMALAPAPLNQIACPLRAVHCEAQVRSKVKVTVFA